MTAPALPLQLDRPGQAARENWEANLPALQESQEELVGALPPVQSVLWLYGRDGSLTCKTTDDQWLAGNSLPHRSAARILRSMNISHTVGCFLDVPHAAFLRRALEQLHRNQAVVAVIPEPEQLSLLLHCADFSTEIAHGRLWFTTGEDWAKMLAMTFDSQPGLPIPGAFIRTPLTSETTLQEMIKRAQACFSAASERRAEMLARTSKLRNSQRFSSAEAGRVPCIGVIAPSDFRLWDPSADVLRNLTCRQESGSDDVSWQMIDPDLPASASSLALARMAAESEAILSANIFRSAAPGAVPIDLPWIVWVTRPSIPPYEGGANDRLILVDDGWVARAQRAGWPEKQIRVAGWPSLKDATTESSDQPRALVLIADTVEVPANPDHFELSSHSLLWETIRQQLWADPFTLRIDPPEYLRNQMQQYNVAGEGLDAALFVNQLIIPTYQQSLVRILLNSGIPIKIYGNGWPEISDFSAAASGLVTDSTAFFAAINSGAALLHLWPALAAHPITAMGKPVACSAGSSRSKFVADARQALNGRMPPTGQRAEPLNLRMILSALF